METEIALSKLKARIDLYHQKKNRKKRYISYAWRVAASVAIILCLSYIGWKEFPEEKVIVMNRVYMPDGKKGAIMLPDGSSVWLNENSRISYAEDFLSGQRAVKLEGEAFFDVVRNEKSPFTVQTRQTEITVLGTSFNVNDTENTIEAVLQTGSIHIKLKASEKEFTLKPNERFYYSDLDRNIALENVDACLYSIWTRDRLFFDNVKLADVISRLEHWYGIRIEYPASLPEARMTFTVRNETKEQTFKAISEVAPIGYRIDGRKVVLYARNKN
ncbi:MAG: FecR domain-containing protein [Tannerella sp.]|nr:FecR domain-containing protein [Tannerella sp.]